MTSISKMAESQTLVWSTSLVSHHLAPLRKGQLTLLVFIFLPFGIPLTAKQLRESDKCR